MNIHMCWEALVHYTIKIAYNKKSILCVDFFIGKSNLNAEICYIIVRKIISFLTSMIYLLLNPFKRLLSFL